MYQQFSFNETGTGHDTITFSFRDDPGYIALDNVAVQPVLLATPEPNIVFLMGAGFVGAAGVLRLKFRS